MACEYCGKKSGGLLSSGLCPECKLLRVKKPQFQSAKKERLPKQHRVFLANLDSLISLCHPDRHDNSERSTRITQWLLQVKESTKSGASEKPDILEGNESGKWKKRRK